MIQGVEADRLNALKTAAEVSVAAALHADTTRGKNKQTEINTVVVRMKMASTVYYV